MSFEIKTLLRCDSCKATILLEGLERPARWAAATKGWTSRRIQDPVTKTRPLYDYCPTCSKE